MSVKMTIEMQNIEENSIGYFRYQR